MKYGYARVSTAKQSIARQLQNIKAFAPDAIIMEEVYTGTEIDRPTWNRLMKIIKTGDTIIFDEVSRLSRNAEEGFTAYQNLFNKGVRLIFLKQRHIDTEVFEKSIQNQIHISVNTGRESTDNLISGMTEVLNRFMLDIAKEQIRIALEQSQAEVEHIHQRTSEGVKRAVQRYNEEEANGTPHLKKKPGRQAESNIQTKKSVEMKEKIRKMSKKFSGCMNDKEIMETLGLARNTYYKYLREMKEGAEA